jgi:pyochelin biosynthetic protein PchG
MSMKVVVCGSNYGRLYVPAIQGIENLEVRAILGRDSQRSKDLAAEARVPLLSEVTSLPDDVEMACVATTSFKQGPLILSLLDGGIHVLAEHPVSADLIRAARSGRYKAELHVNSLFSDTAIAHQYFELAEEKRRNNSLLFATGYCMNQTLFSWLDIVVRAIGCTEIRDINIRTLEKLDLVDFQVGDVTVAAAIQTRMDPTESRRNTIFTHSLNLGFLGGVLSLGGSYGPLTWVPSLGLAEPQNALYDFVSGQTPQNGTDMLAMREAANVHALKRLMETIKGGKDFPEQSTEHLVAISQASEMIDLRIRNGEVKHA